jgi:hypothetical protein
LNEERWARIDTATRPAREAVLDHAVYRSLDNRQALHTFMEHHVWAVWDFMSLLTRLQRDLTCVEVPWVPRPVDAAAQRLINEIKLGEESDTHPDGGWTSHFSLYLAAMEEVGADTGPVRRAVAGLASGAVDPTRTSPGDLLGRCGAPQGASEFVASTFAVVVRGSTLEVAAAFALGREQLIPEMFTHLVQGSDGRLLIEYLERHVELDQGEHGPLSHRLVEHLAGNDPANWQLVEHAAERAIGARLRLWDSVVAALEPARVTG